MSKIIPAAAGFYMLSDNAPRRPVIGWDIVGDTPRGLPIAPGTDESGWCAIEAPDGSIFDDDIQECFTDDPVDAAYILWRRARREWQARAAEGKC